jgi:predicted phage baseplate assembly protein
MPGQVGLAPTPISQVWDFVPRILDADAEDRIYSVEHGMWREIVRHQRPAGDVVLRDYAGNDGFSIRFGDRAFGIAPTDATIFQASYLSAPGIAANLPADRITSTSEPGGSGGSTLPYATAVTNPFPISSARLPEDLESIRLNAPQAWQSILLRAVRSDDYREILERRDDLQAARATARWTGSWSTDFIAVDPLGTTRLSTELRASVEAELDCIRQAGRDVCLREPSYVPLDLRIDICAEPDASNAALVRAITRRLANRDDPNSLFHPDRLSFGDALIRSDLEAEIQCVTGVRGVESIQVRRRGLHDFRALGMRLEVAPHQILQLANDPAHPERGSLRVEARGGG